MKNRPLLVVALMVALAAPFWMGGCTNQQLEPQGVYQSLAVYNAERTIVNSYLLMDNFLEWEHSNRASLAAVPEIKQVADHIRANGQQWIETAIALNEAYKIDPSETNRTALEGALEVIDAALLEAVKYMSANR
jgi:hypothetical protein